MLDESYGEQVLRERAWLRRELPSWNELAPLLQVRVGSRAARVADALHAGDDPAQAAAWVVPLGPRLALDLVVRAERGLVPVAHHLGTLGVPLSVALRVAMHEPRRWLRPGGGAIQVSCTSLPCRTSPVWRQSTSTMVHNWPGCCCLRSA